ncbi:MAG TPA: dTMP kinase, partial [Gemmatimonadaceae bacterium]|nr:dTMP kinase [Gemmatimonadaceae bacterium]
MSSRLIVFEGPEGAGKTTQLQLLARWFDARGEQVVTLREPGGTPIGDEIRRLVLDPARTMTMRTEALLFIASRAELIDSVVRPALDRGSTVLVDRFLLSTYAYQGAGRGIGDDELRAANRVATRDLAPTLTLLLHLPAGEGLARVALRGAPDRMERSDAAFHDRIERAFEV